MSKAHALLFAPLLLIATLITTGCAQQTTPATGSSKAAPAKVSASTMPNPYRSQRTDELNTDLAYMEVGGKTYYLYSMPATEKHANNEYTKLLDAPANLDSGFYESEYLQLQDKQGHVLYGDKLDFYQAIYVHRQVVGGSEAQGAPSVPKKYPNLTALTTKIKTSTIPEAQAKQIILKEAHAVWDGVDTSSLGFDDPTPPTYTKEEKREQTLLAHINHRVTDIQVAITGGDDIKTLAGRKTYANGDIVEVKIFDNGSRYTVTGKTKDGKYKGGYDSETGEVTPN